MRRAKWVLVVVLCLLIAAVYPAIAQTQQLTGYVDGYEAGRVAAKAEIKTAPPFMGGLFLGVFYLAYSVLADGKMPPPGRVQALHGSDEYKRGYLEGYQEEWQSIRTRNALAGWGASVAVLLVYYAVVFSLVLGAY
jgi:hypothetical protein